MRGKCNPSLNRQSPTNLELLRKLEGRSALVPVNNLILSKNLKCPNSCGKPEVN